VLEMCEGLDGSTAEAMFFYCRPLWARAVYASQASLGHRSECPAMARPISVDPDAGIRGVPHWEPAWESLDPHRQGALHVPHWPD
jgi:hypothetical protein